MSTGSAPPDGSEIRSRSVSSGSGEKLGSQNAVEAKVFVSIASRSNGTPGRSSPACSRRTTRVTGSGNVSGVAFTLSIRACTSLPT
jgi:hypothetical protein